MITSPFYCWSISWTKTRMTNLWVLIKELNVSHYYQQENEFQIILGKSKYWTILSFFLLKKDNPLLNLQFIAIGTWNLWSINLTASSKEFLRGHQSHRFHNPSLKMIFIWYVDIRRLASREKGQEKICLHLFQGEMTNQKSVEKYLLIVQRTFWTWKNIWVCKKTVEWTKIIQFENSKKGDNISWPGLFLSN